MRIFILEDDPVRIDYFQKAIAPGNEVVWADTYEKAVEALETTLEPFDVAYLDHDLGDIHTYADGRRFEFCGSDVVRYITDKLDPEFWPKKFIVHSWNPVGARYMTNTLREHGASVVQEPFAGKKIEDLKL
jgi:hypothetical protein